MKRTAVITGIAGQVASYLAELLLAKDYKIYGLKRRTSKNDLGCSAHLEKYIEVVEGDMCDTGSLNRLCRMARPDELYNTAAMSHVGTSFEQPEYTLEVTGGGVLNCLEAIRQSGIHTRMLQCSTSELFGGGEAGEQPRKVGLDVHEFHPKSPYAAAKLFGFWICDIYRASYKMYVCNSLAFNHDGPRRGPNFVTRKITLAIANIVAGNQNEVMLGNMDAMRDWGHAKDYVEGMYLMLQQPKARDYILATGETHSVREFCEYAFKYAGLGDYRNYIAIDPRLYRPSEVPALLGDYSETERLLGWRPKTTFRKLVEEMVDSDMAALGVVKPARQSDLAETI